MLEVISTQSALQKFRQSLKVPSVGLVPTMGNLHAGHLGLIEKSLEAHPACFITIFVNPKQFGPNEDFQRYPRTPESDIEKINELLKNSPRFTGKKVALFLPSSVEEVFPPGYDTTLSVGALTRILCGRNRPGHFDGVATVVHRLFALTRPTHAYFGEKDYQQLLVIKKMVHDLLLDIQIVPVPIYREADGLARSSRNQYLTSEDRPSALELSQTLAQIRETLLTEKQLTSHALKLVNQLREAKTQNGNWDYLELLRSADLNPPSVGETQLVALGALRIGKTRLIDNVLINLGQTTK